MSCMQARNGSLFPSAIFTLYCTYLCYSALVSEPHDYICNGLGQRINAASATTLATGGSRCSFPSRSCHVALGHLAHPSDEFHAWRACQPNVQKIFCRSTGTLETLCPVRGNSADLRQAG